MGKKTINVFVSYAQREQKWAFSKLLEILEYIEVTNKSKFNLEIHYDRRFEAGRNFDKDIADLLRKSEIIVVLVTQRFLLSPYIYRNERPLIIEAANKKKNVIPVIVGVNPIDYKESWLAALHVTTLPSHLNEIITSSTHMLWAEVKLGLKKKILSTHKAKSNLLGAGSSDGCSRKLLLGLGITVVLVVLFPNIQNWIKNYTKQTTEVVTPTPPAPPFNPNPPAPPKPSPAPHVIDDPIVDEYDDESDSRNRRRENILPNPEKKRRPTFEPELEKLVKYYEINDVQKIPRPLGGHPYHGAEPYGRYESCQAVNSKGYKPCKKGQRWFLVNEVKNIHHKISFPDIMHKQIYAIRPYYDDFAEVYFHNGTEMYLIFCLDMEDQPEYCMTKFAD